MYLPRPSLRLFLALKNLAVSISLVALSPLHVFEYPLGNIGNGLPCGVMVRELFCMSFRLLGLVDPFGDFFYLSSLHFSLFIEPTNPTPLLLNPTWYTIYWSFTPLPSLHFFPTMSNNVHAFLDVVDIYYHDSVWYLFLFPFKFFLRWKHHALFDVTLACTPNGLAFFLK
jgi:hypothetical protein